MEPIFLAAICNIRLTPNEKDDELANTTKPSTKDKPFIWLAKIHFIFTLKFKKAKQDKWRVNPHENTSQHTKKENTEVQYSVIRIVEKTSFASV